MSTHFYAFGSICRGELDLSSDIDLLACVSTPRLDIDPEKFSIYTYDRIKMLWSEGNPFAWHLYLESKMIYSSDNEDFIKGLGLPAEYLNSNIDCKKFRSIFLEASNSLKNSKNSVVFNLSCMFLAMRNFATCFSFRSRKPVFSRKSPLLIENSIPISNETYELFSRARILSTRGYGTLLSDEECLIVQTYIPVILNWMDELIKDDKNQ
ncbi:nucleotidyltransferase [Acinetobacter bereziniae]|uniref:nucleotidyltransferase n=1 Tax=Acinetobacter bereziniae TaxID=106648 RepID=UPI00124F5961|nr:nucleotidyltransferase [Acinetobacter bereziniae]